MRHLLFSMSQSFNMRFVYSKSFGFISRCFFEGNIYSILQPLDYYPFSTMGTMPFRYRFEMRLK